MEHGEIFLHRAGQRDRAIRLRWTRAGERRALPAGTYAVSGYRHVAKDDDGVQWIWSSTSNAFRELRVEAGKTVRLDVRRTLRLQTRAKRAKGALQVSLAFVAEPKLGHTLYRDGTRIPIGWECLDERGEILAHGPTTYG